MDLAMQGKVVLVVGGTRGIGLHVARLLAAEGATLAIVGRDATDVERATTGIPSAVGFAADAGVPGGLDDVFAALGERFGRLDGLYTAAGWSPRNSPLPTATDDDFVELHEQIYLSTVRACRGAVALMAAHGGAIVTTGAYSARVPGVTRVGYSAMKAAIVNFTKNLALAHGRDGIRANCVCPGAVRAGVVVAAVEAKAREHGIEPEQAERQLLHEWGMGVALGRLGSAEEVGDVVAFLLSPRAAYVSGAVVNVDGGTDF